MKRRKLILRLGPVAADAIAVSAQLSAVRERLRTFRQGLKATRQVEGERGCAVLRSLFGALLLSGAMAMPAAAEDAPGVPDSQVKIGHNNAYTGPGAWLSSHGSGRN